WEAGATPASPVGAVALRPPRLGRSQKNRSPVSNAIQNCPLKPDPCKALAEEIDELINRDKRLSLDGGRHGLKHRFREQINGQSGPGSKSWDDHDRAIREQQKGLRDRLDEFNRNNCGDKFRIPDDAWSWASRPVPRPADWKDPRLEMAPEPTPLPIP